MREEKALALRNSEMKVGGQKGSLKMKLEGSSGLGSSCCQPH